MANHVASRSQATSRPVPTGPDLVELALSLVGRTDPAEVLGSALDVLATNPHGGAWALLRRIDGDRYEAVVGDGPGHEDLRRLADAAGNDAWLAVNRPLAPGARLGRAVWCADPDSADGPDVVVVWWPPLGDRRRAPTLRRSLVNVARLIGKALAASVSFQSLLALSCRDPLTGVLNRRGILGALDHELARADRAGSPVSVLFLDLNGFKFVNDRLGHRAGDEALIAASRLLAQEMRSADLLGRIGGDEMLAVLPDTGLRSACRIARRLGRKLYATPIHTSAGSARLGLTYGAAGLDEGLAGPALVETADRRMLYRKQRGGNTRQPPLLCPTVALGPAARPASPVGAPVGTHARMER